jgi:hypothetical protein
MGWTLNHMRRITILLIFVSATLVGQDFTGQAYVLTRDLDEATCRTASACDCCFSELIFIDASRFGLIRRCIHNDTYYGGTYAVTQSELKLIFKSFSVKETIENFDEANEKTINTNTESDIKTTEFEIGSCQPGFVRLINSQIMDFSNGVRVRPDREAAIFKHLKTKKAWTIVQGSGQ